MLKLIRQKIVQSLWESYSQSSQQMQTIIEKLNAKGVKQPALDHFAIIDLPSQHSGIPQLKEIFTDLGFIVRGKDYLAEKQNDFVWLTEEDSDANKAQDVLPQVVIADFRLEEMPIAIRQIIEKYSQQTCPTITAEIKQAIQKLNAGDTDQAEIIVSLVCKYFNGRDWSLPTANEFHTVQAFNELLAWVLVFGRTPNHFTLSIHLLNIFANLEEFHQFVEFEVGLPLNKEGGVLKGGEMAGIAQGSTIGDAQKVALADATVAIPNNFVEFVWRFSAEQNSVAPIMWKDYFTGFIAQHADRVIESLYSSENKLN